MPNNILQPKVFTGGASISDFSSATSGNIASQRNYLINASMFFGQRGVTFSNLAAGYTLDRWYSTTNFTSTSISQTQNTAVNGTYSALRMTNTTRGAGSFFILFQPMETQTVMAFMGQTVTVSFLARASGLSSGALAASMTYTTTVDDSAINQVNGINIGSLSIPAASLTSVFQTFTFTVNVPTTARSSAVAFNAPAINDGSYVEITNVMLNRGSVAAPFTLAGHNAAGELAMCQRYFEKSFPIGTTPAYQVQNDIEYQVMGQYAASSSQTGKIPFKVTKRIVPTLATYNPYIAANGNPRLYTTSNTSTDGVAVNNFIGQNGWGFYQATAAYTLATVQWAVDAEL